MSSIFCLSTIWMSSNIHVDNIICFHCANIIFLFCSLWRPLIALEENDVGDVDLSAVNAFRAVQLTQFMEVCLEVLSTLTCGAFGVVISWRSPRVCTRRNHLMRVSCVHSDTPSIGGPQLTPLTSCSRTTLLILFLVRSEFCKRYPMFIHPLSISPHYFIYPEQG